ncbi:hypothetical protein ScPMuIL_012830 [Solemya velum]
MSNSELQKLGYLSGSKIEILVSCSDLANLDDFTKSDPICVLFIKQFGQWNEYARSETVRESLNPKFTETFMMIFEPSIQQQLMFCVFDIDNRSTNLKQHDMIGSVEVTLAGLLEPFCQICSVCKTLRVSGDPRPRGMISITTEVVKESKDKVNIHVGGHKLEKKGKYAKQKPDTFLEVSRSVDNLTYHPIHRTETVIKSRYPRWRPFEIGIQKLCNGDWDRRIELTCCYINNGESKVMGRKVTTLREMQISRREGNFQKVSLTPVKKEKTQRAVLKSVVGILYIFQFKTNIHYSLIDYVRGGLQMNLMIAIDFTASNGSVDDKLSLHGMTNPKGNLYLDAMDKMGTILSQYNMDQKIAVLGFGARLEGESEVSHCFSLTGEDNMYVKGIEGVRDVYTRAVRKLTFAGPTCLSQILEKARLLASDVKIANSRQDYNILLVITDGILNDIDETVEKIIAASYLPFSIIIVGVGPADFNLMEQFNTTNIPLRSNRTGSLAKRKNTHFVAFRKENLPFGGNMVMAREAMGTVSSQVVGYFKTQGEYPNKPILAKTDPQNSWMDSLAGEETYSTSDSAILRSTSQERQLFGNKIGPSCPTCGAIIQPGTNLHTNTPNLQ